MKPVIAVLCGSFALACASAPKRTDTPTPTPNTDEPSTSASRTPTTESTTTESRTSSSAPSTWGPSAPAETAGRQPSASSTDRPNEALPATPPVSPPPASTNGPNADNTRVNERDRDPKALTPLDQGNNSADLETTKQIRQAVVGDGSLSFTAKNVKIITVNGRVTLRGPVKTDKERTTIEAAAKKVAGDGNVDDQLDVKK